MVTPAESAIPSPPGPLHRAHAAEAAGAVAQAPAAAPAVAVIILSSGDLDLLDRSLDALSRQDLHAPYEVLVVDDAWESATARLVTTWEHRFAGDSDVHGHTHGTSQSGHSGHSRERPHAIAHPHARVRYVASQPAHGATVSALNLGWRSTAAPLVAFTGVDTVAAVDWLRHGLAGFAGGEGTVDVSASIRAACYGNGPVAAEAAAAPAQHRTEASPGLLGGTAAADAVFGRVDSILPKHPTEVQRDIHLRDGGSFSQCNWFIRRSMLDRLGGFDARFADAADATTDLHCRMLASGACMVHAAAAAVTHPVGPASWGASLLELRRLSSEALLEYKHPRLYREHMHRPAQPLWHDLAVVAALLLTGLGVALHHEVLTVAAAGTWLVLTAMLCIRRLRDTARTAGHIAEVLLTSSLMPPLALFWRLVGSVRYRTRFARP